MSREKHGVSTALVPIIPDRTEPVLWEKTTLPSLQGSLLNEPGCPAEVIDTMLVLAQAGGSSPAGLKWVGAGMFGSVFEKNGIAYKIHFPETVQNLLPASELVANVALSVGLKRIKRRQDTSKMHHNGAAVTFSAPEYYGGFVPDSTALRTRSSRFVIAMSFEEGRPATNATAPQECVRLAQYREAVGACALDPVQVVYDDRDRLGNVINTFVRPGESDNSMDVIKFDVMAGYDFAKNSLGL